MAVHLIFCRIISSRAPPAASEERKRKRRPGAPFFIPPPRDRASAHVFLLFSAKILRLRYAVVLGDVGGLFPPCYSSCSLHSIPPPFPSSFFFISRATSFGLCVALAYGFVVNVFFRIRDPPPPARCLRATTAARNQDGTGGAALCTLAAVYLPTRIFPFFAEIDIFERGHITLFESHCADRQKILFPI